METYRAKQIMIVALITTVVLQVIYMAALGGPQPAEAGQPTTGADVIRYFDERGAEVTAVWLIEAVAFLTIAVTGFFMLARGGLAPLAMVALGLSGVFNTIQIGMGLSMFDPVARVGGDDPSLFYAVVAGAFFLYMTAKALIGLAALALGLKVAAQAGGVAKAIGWLAILTGGAALAANVAGMGMGFPLLFAAGATGTLATLFAALALSRVSVSE